MITLEHETRVAAPATRVFLLSLSIDLHQDSASQTSERAVDGVARGIIGPGQTVTWRGRHSGLMLQHKALITRYEAPHLFEDVMVRGVFKSFVHQHSFRDVDGGTMMRDTLTFSAPLGPLGWIAERLFLRRHMDTFLKVRNQHIKHVAESDEWQKILAVSMTIVIDYGHEGRQAQIRNDPCGRVQGEVSWFAGRGA